MSLGKFSLEYRTSLLVLTGVFVLGGLLAYTKMGRLEDPAFTIKQAQVITAYPGATTEEVEKRVTEVIEKAAQQLGQVDYVRSTSSAGLSVVDVLVKDRYNRKLLPQVWDELRRKIVDVQRQLPQGASVPTVYDDFGDVFGVFFAITGDGYSMADLADVARFMQRELTTVDDVARVTIIGAEKEAVYIEMSPARMAQFGIAREQIYKVLQSHNLVIDAGDVSVEDLRVAIRPTGEFQSVEEIGDLLITDASAGAGLVYLRDLATVRSGYADPPQFLLRVDGKPSVGLAISTVEGGNVVFMGEALKRRMEEIHAQRLIPFGIEYHKISIQSEAVTTAIDGFVASLFQAVVIVIVVLLIFMGLRSGLIIGVVLLITIIGSFVFMYGMGIMLERISLGALIIALGMLVDNAIVIAEGMLVRIKCGENRGDAADQVVRQNALPLLGATLVAILAFAAIGASNDSSGEYTRSLFQVIMISLLYSWITAVTVTPLLCAMYLRPDNAAAGPQDPYRGRLFHWYRASLEMALRHRLLVMATIIVFMGLSFVGFTHIETAFFPSSTRPQIMVDFWLREGTRIDVTREKAIEVEKLIASCEHVTSVASFIGQGPPRFLLTLSPESTNPAYAHFLVSFDDYRVVDNLLADIQTRLEEQFPEAIPQAFKFALGPGVANKIQVRVSGPDTHELRRIADRVMDIMHDDKRLIGIQTDWRDKVFEYIPVLRDSQARQLGIERATVANLIKETFGGRQVGVFQQDDDMLPIVVRAPEDERTNIGLIGSLTVMSPATGGAVPLSQIVSEYKLSQTDSTIKRRDRVRTITVKCNPRSGNTSKALSRLMPEINAIEMPPGYQLVYGGEYEDSNKANAALKNKVLFCGLFMVLIVVLLFNAIRQPLIIWLCVPMALIGVVIGLLISGQPFGFMALLGLLSLSGMLIKNAIVLVDEIDLQRKAGKDTHAAIVDSGVSRMRPVMMAAGTTVLGMVPLLLDAFFVAMAVTIMAGLTFATLLTLIVVPVLYSLFLGGRRKPSTSPEARQ